MEMEFEKVLVVKDVPQSNPCLSCVSCVRLRLMEMGVVPGQRLRIKKFQETLWVISVMENDVAISTFGLRDDEMERILFEEECVVSLV